MPGPRFRVTVSQLQRRRLEHIQAPEAHEPTPPRSAQLQADDARERRTQWPTNPPWDSKPIDLRPFLLAVGAGVTPLLTFRLQGGREGVIKRYAVGFLDSSLIPAPLALLTFQLNVNGSPITPQEGLPSFSVISGGQEDALMQYVTYGIRGGETVQLLVNNASGLALDLWARLTGWQYNAPTPTA